MTQNSDSPPLDAEHFFLGEYLPLPSLIRAAKLHFRERNLPNIRRASNTDPAYLRAQEIINEPMKQVEGNSSSSQAFLGQENTRRDSPLLRVGIF